MRILFLSQLLPYPLDSGVKIRMYFTLRQLAQDHDVTLACFVRHDNTPDEIAHLNAFCRDVRTVLMQRSLLKDARFLIQSVLANRSFVIIRDTVPAMQRLVDALLEEAEREGRPYDAVHSDQLWMAQYALYARSRVSNRGFQMPKLVLDQHNAVHLILRRMALHARNPLKRGFLAWESRKLARYEADTCRRFDHVITVTDEDKRALSRLYAGGPPPMTIIPICVDPSSVPVVPRDPESKTILHLGTMYWPPNIEGVLWFAREILPRVRRKIPGGEFCVVGKTPPRSVLELAAGDSAVSVAGYVADPEPYLRDSAVFVVPLHAGGGMRVKILDAWLWGIPIVSTTIGAEGIDVQEGENILIADDADAFAEAVVRLLDDRELAQRLAANGREWVERRYDWRVRYQALDEVYAFS
jgi:glycosyltransferase involved in cell wall biosynthesis